MKGLLLDFESGPCQVPSLSLCPDPPGLGPDACRGRSPWGSGWGERSGRTQLGSRDRGKPDIFGNTRGSGGEPSTPKGAPTEPGRRRTRTRPQRSLHHVEGGTRRVHPDPPGQEPLSDLGRPWFGKPSKARHRMWKCIPRSARP